MIVYKVIQFTGAIKYFYILTYVKDRSEHLGFVANYILSEMRKQTPHKVAYFSQIPQNWLQVLV